jgi:hypothetical protein
MGRSVSYPSGAIVAFADYSDEQCEDCDGTGKWSEGADEEDDDQDAEYEGECETCDGTGYIEAVADWDDEADYLRGWIKEIFPSFEPCDKWLDREDHAIAENSFAYFGISEYCGLVALWLVRKELDWDSSANEAMQDRWLAQVEKKFLATFGTLRKLGSMSNGEGVYERIERA